MISEIFNLSLNMIAAIFVLLAGGICLGSWQNKRPWLLLPAAVYGISGALSLIFGSWWPVFIGFPISRLMQDLRVGLGKSSPQFPSRGLSLTKFLGNHILHIGAGIAGANVFLISSNGWILVILFSFIVQGLDTYGFYHMYKRLLTDTPDALKQLPTKVAWILTMKIFWYGSVTMLTAMVIRNLN
jgi:hypothetical protein